MVPDWNLFKLTMGEFMTKNVVTIYPDEAVLEAAKKLAEHSIGSLPVVNENNEVVGIFTERDLLEKVVVERKDPAGTSVSEVMTTTPKTLEEDASISEAFKLTQSQKFRHIPIVKNGKLTGIVSVRDITEAFYEGRRSLTGGLDF